MNTKNKIGILGGMGPEALSDMYLAICKYYQDHFGAKYDKDFPPMIMYSVPIPDVVESLENEQEILKELINTAKILEEDGCDFIVIACNSVQFLLNDIKAQITIPIIGIAETVAKDIKQIGYKKVGILSTQTTINKKVYDEEMNKIGIELLAPSAEQQGIVTEVIMNQLSGKATSKDTQKLVQVVDSLTQKDAGAVLIACTDLPFVIKQSDVDIPLVNCTYIYANEAARLSAS